MKERRILTVKVVGIPVAREPCTLLEDLNGDSVDIL